MSWRTPGQHRASTQTLAEHDEESVPGLPGPLPLGETLLWQGAPRWQSLARSLHVRGLSVYFLLLIAARAATGWDGDADATLATVLPLLGVSLVALGLICLFAWLTARTTIYSLTDRRVVLRYGAALSKAVNLPFALVDGASVRLNADGTGDVVLRIGRSERLPYLMLWPNARPWRFSPAQPMLRAIPDAAMVAQRLARALAAATGGQVEPLAPLAAPDRAHGPAGAVAA